MITSGILNNDIMDNTKIRILRKKKNARLQFFPLQRVIGGYVNLSLSTSLTKIPPSYKWMNIKKKKIRMNQTKKKCFFFENFQF